MDKANNKLKGRIVEKGFTVRGLAEKSCIPVGTLSDKLNGRSEFKASEIAAISKILDIEDVALYFF